MTSNRDTARFGGMLVLPMSAFRGNQIPTIGFDQPDDVTNLQLPFALTVDGWRRLMLHYNSNTSCRQVALDYLPTDCGVGRH